MSVWFMVPFVFKVRVTLQQQRRSGIRLDKQKWGEVSKVIKIQASYSSVAAERARSTGRLRARLQSHRPQGEVELTAASARAAASLQTNRA